MNSKGRVMEGVCRCCGAQKRCRVLNIQYEWCGRREVYADMFVDCFGLLLSQLDSEEADRLICATCVTRLRDAVDFRHQVLQCEERLLRATIHLHSDDIGGDGGESIKKESSIKDEKLMEFDPQNEQEEISHSDEDNTAFDATDSVKNESDGSEEKPRTRSKGKKKTKEKWSGRREMLLSMRRTREKLNRLLKIDKPKQTTGKKITKVQHNIMTLVENSYMCPFDNFFSIFYCVYCKKKFTEPAELREHNLTHDPSTFRHILLSPLRRKNERWTQIDVQRVDCRLCSLIIDDVDSLRRHLSTIHGKTIYSVENEFLKFRLTPNPTCYECQKPFTFFYELRKHMAEHFGTYICDICGIHYFEERMLKAHLKVHQNVAKKYQCAHCPRVFQSNYSRQIHIARVHTKEAAYECSKCDQMFFSNKERQTHMMEVHDEQKVFHCDQCEKEFNSRRALLEHKKRIHLKLLKHQCDICNRRFYSPALLREHMPTHTGERNYKCEHCGKSFPRPKSLRVHLECHNSVKKYKCSLCSASFAQNVCLKNHMKRQHQGMDDNV